MKTKLAGLSIAIGVLLSPPAMADDYVTVSNGTHGPGALPCAVYSKLRTTNNADRTGDMMLTWVQGYISGLNVGIEGVTGDKSNIPLPKDRSFIGWLDQRCEANPKSSVMNVVTDYLAE